MIVCVKYRPTSDIEDSDLVFSSWHPTKLPELAESIASAIDEVPECRQVFVLFHDWEEVVAFASYDDYYAEIGVDAIKNGFARYEDYTWPDDGDGAFVSGLFRDMRDKRNTILREVRKLVTDALVRMNAERAAVEAEAEADTDHDRQFEEFKRLKAIFEPEARSETDKKVLQKACDALVRRNVSQ